MKTLDPCPVTTSRDGEPFYVWRGTVVPPSTADLYAAHKRLCDAEIAAEFWRSMWAIEHDGSGYFAELEALERFATTPHASLTDWDLR